MRMEREACFPSPAKRLAVTLNSHSSCLSIHFRFFPRNNKKIFGLFCWDSHLPIFGKYGQPLSAIFCHSPRLRDFSSKKKLCRTYSPLQRWCMCLVSSVRGLNEQPRPPTGASSRLGTTFPPPAARLPFQALLFQTLWETCAHKRVKILLSH